MNPTITIPKDLFDALLEDAYSVKENWHWIGYGRQEYDALCARIEQALEIRKQYDNHNTTLLDRINRVINTRSFERVLEENSVDLIDFQCSWQKISGGKFENLPKVYQEAILAGENVT